ncbi:MAG: aldo/keto reductase [Armatimonadota bacterium]
MNEDRFRETDRRGFLRDSALIAGAGLLLGGASEAWGQGEPRPVPTRKFGRTGMDVPIIILGTVPLNTPVVVQRALEWKMDFIHTSSTYGKGAAVRALAEAIKGKADKVRIGYKCWFRPGEVDEALKILGVDHLDVVFFPTTNPEQVRLPHVKEEFDRLKQAGKVRFLGLTSHGNMADVMRAGVEAGYYDVLMPAYNVPAMPALDPVLTQAKKEKDLGVLIMKSAKGIPRDQTLANVWATMLGKPFNAVITKGLNSVQTVDRAAQFALNYQAFRDDAKVQGLAEAMVGVVCSMCGNCTKVCPRGINPCEIFRYEMYATEYGLAGEARAHYARLPASRNAAACDDCGECEAVCGNDLPVRRRLREAHGLLA